MFAFLDNADMPTATMNVRYWGQSGHRADLPPCPLLTHERHWLCTAAMVLIPFSGPIEVLM